MKTRNLFCMLVMVVVAAGFVSCENDDEKVDASALVGMWTEIIEESRAYGALYSFNEDGTYLTQTDDSSPGRTTLHGTYRLNGKNRWITLHCEETGTTEIYYITWSDNNMVMTWKKLSPKDGQPDKVLHSYYIN